MSYKQLDPEDLVISSDSVTAAIWSNNTPTLNSFFTSSTQVASNTGNYYNSVYQYDPSNASASVQFALTYADKQGSGSVLYNPLVDGASPTRTIFGQYRTLVLGDENQDFTFGNFTSSYFYVISIDRSRYKEKLFPGSLTLKLGTGAGTISLTDDSKYASSTTFTDAGRIFNLISGSSGTLAAGYGVASTTGYTPGSGSYGVFLPDIATIILNASALDGVLADGGIALSTGRTSNTNDTNPAKLYSALKTGGNFTLNSEETISSNFIFIRARNSEFNYTENPSYISGSTGEIVYSNLINNPQTFITTVGLYNVNNELLAVAKLSRPLPKDFTKELLIRAKLDF